MLIKTISNHPQITGLTRKVKLKQMIITGDRALIHCNVEYYDGSDDLVETKAIHTGQATIVITGDTTSLVAEAEALADTEIGLRDGNNEFD